MIIKEMSFRIDCVLIVNSSFIMVGVLFSLGSIQLQGLLLLNECKLEIIFVLFLQEGIMVGRFFFLLQGLVKICYIYNK